MPHEKTYGAKPYGDDEPARGVASVHWYRDGASVNLATWCLDETTGEVFARVLNKDANVAEVQAMRAGYYVDLDRAAINKLIRDLRRARDQVFGRDE